MCFQKMFNFCFIPSPKEKQAHFPNKMPDAERRYRGPTFFRRGALLGERRGGLPQRGGRGIMGGIVCNKGGKREGRVGKQLKVLFLVHAYYTLHLLISTKVKPQKTACAVVTCFVDNQLENPVPPQKQIKLLLVLYVFR